jgi:hypothetical protein
MPNNILITPGSASIQFSGSAANTIRLQVESSGSVAFYGNSGSLFGIVDNLSGSLMSVNDVSGLPILEVFSDDRVVIGTLNQNTLVVTGSRVGIRKSVPTANLDVSGSVLITGSLGVSGSTNINGSLTLDATSEFIANGPVRSRINLNSQTGSYTLALGDEGKLVLMTSGGVNFVTIPSSSTANFSTGSQIMITQEGSGQTRITSASTGVTLRSANAALKIANQYSAATIVKTNINTWYVFGDLVV